MRGSGKYAALLYAMTAMAGVSPTLTSNRPPRLRNKSKDVYRDLPDMIANLQDRLDDHNDQMSGRGVNKEFEVQGFDGIKAINQKNATKRFRKILGQTGFPTDMTSENLRYRSEYYRLNEELKNTSDPQELIEISNQLKELTGHIGLTEVASGIDF